MADRKPIRRALISVYDKARLVEIGKVLSDAGVEILSTGSTAKNLASAGSAFIIDRTAPPTKFKIQGRTI
jgi:phosphoribosylaminoimidazolecarboxamide formyltransferase/IMP cyclohydrolase